MDPNGHLDRWLEDKDDTDTGFLIYLIIVVVLDVISLILDVRDVYQYLVFGQTDPIFVWNADGDEDEKGEAEGTPQPPLELPSGGDNDTVKKEPAKSKEPTIGTEDVEKADNHANAVIIHDDEYDA